MRGFTLVELIVVAAVVALVAMLGLRSYFTYVESYRFQHLLTEFKSSVNLARARSMSGVVSMGGTVGDTPAAFMVNKIAYSDPTSVVLTTSTEHKITKDSLPVYLTLMGFSPKDTTTFKTPNLFPWYINGPQCKVKDIGGDKALTVDVGLQVGTYVNADLMPTAVAFMNYAVQIRPVEAIQGGSYSMVLETGPRMDFQYLKSMVAVTFQTTETGSTQQPQGTIVFRRGLTSGEKTYKVSFSLIKSRGEDSMVTYDVLPAGAVR